MEPPQHQPVNAFAIFFLTITTLGFYPIYMHIRLLEENNRVLWKIRHSLSEIVGDGKDGNFPSGIMASLGNVEHEISEIDLTLGSIKQALKKMSGDDDSELF